MLRGTKAANGGCDYRYPTTQQLVPENGWVLRSIGINMSSCTKLMEEGSPIEPIDLSTDSESGASTSKSLRTLFSRSSGQPQLAATKHIGLEPRGQFQHRHGSSVLSGSTEASLYVHRICVMSQVVLRLPRSSH